MSVIAAHEAQGARWAARDRGAGQTVFAALKRQRLLLLCFTLGFPLIFYLMLMGLLVARFGHLPNYVTAYDWFDNAARIIAGTGSISDMWRIILDEWLLEIGYMNYAYGRGISEWSLVIIPPKVAIVTAIGALIGLNFALIADQKPAATLFQQHARSIRCGLMACLGAICASVPCITLYWVICHSGPTWVVSLAVLGIDLSTSLALEPMGPTLSLVGFSLLVLSALLTIHEGRTADFDPAHSTKETTRC